MAVIGNTCSPDDGIAVLRSTRHEVDLMICDASEHTHQDFQALREVGRVFPEIGIVILADKLSPPDFDLAMASGARAFLPKGVSPAALQSSLELILLGENYFRRFRSADAGDSRESNSRFASRQVDQSSRSRRRCWAASLPRSPV